MIVNGTTYDDATLPEIVQILESARAAGNRLRIHYGDPETGHDWGDTYDVAGTVGRSTGRLKIPLLLPNAASTGGAPISTARIVRIRPSRRSAGPDHYRHPSYKPPMQGSMTDAYYRKHFA